LTIEPERSATPWMWRAASGLRASVQELPPRPPRVLPVLGVIGGASQAAAVYGGGAWFFVEAPARL
jgi:hypothetical protein